MKFDHDLDALGLLCPLPVLKVQKRLKELVPGQVLRLQADDPAARLDVPHFCNEHGHRLVEVAPVGDGAHHYYIEKSR